MRTQDEVESEARAELIRKREVLLKQQQELNRKLKHADRQINKRKKLNNTITQREPIQIEPLRLSTLPFTISTSSKLFCKHHFKLNTLKQNNTLIKDLTSTLTSEQSKDLTSTLTSEQNKDIKTTLISGEFVYKNNLSTEQCPYEPVNTVSHILLRTVSHVFMVHTQNWGVKCWGISPDIDNNIDKVFLFGDKDLLLGLDKRNGRIFDLKTSDLVFECENARIETHCVSSDRLYLSVSVNSETPSYQILTLGHNSNPNSNTNPDSYPNPESNSNSNSDSKSSSNPQTITKLSQFSTPHLIVSLTLTADKLIGTSAGNIYIWSLDGEVRGELALPGSDKLICRAARLRNSHTFLAISCGNTLYSLVLSPDLDDQRLIGEIETQGNVFVCGFYCVFSREGCVCLHNMVTESLSVKVPVSEMKLLDVCLDYPMLLLLSHDSVLLCHFQNP